MSEVAMTPYFLLRFSLLFRSDVNVPGIRMVDASAGLLGIEWIEGKSVKNILPGCAVEDEQLMSESFGKTRPDPLNDFGIASGMYNTRIIILLSKRLLDTLMLLIGTEIAKMHKADIIHGDLTTSNMMLRHPSSLQS